MKTPEEIKRGLKCCMADVDGLAACGDCPYADSTVGCWVEGNTLERDALAYIQQLEESEKRCKKLLGIAYGKLQKAYRELDDVENCTNCLYGDGSHDYCRNCLWFDDENNILKWVSKIEPPKEDHLDPCEYCANE